jgi:hypothetical protein
MTDHLLIDMTRAVIYQQNGIFVSKLIETPQIMKIGKSHHVDMFIQHFRIAIWLSTCFSHHISPEAHVAFSTPLGQPVNLDKQEYIVSRSLKLPRCTQWLKHASTSS